jgi:hypothetical protein
MTQPDTIVPDPYNPQAWNRYAYVLNNPIRFNDPSGHKVCEDVDKKGNCVGDKMARFIDYVHKDILNAKGKIKREYTALAAAELIMKKAALIYGNDWNGFMDATSFAFLGVTWSRSATMLGARFRGGNETESSSVFRGYFTEDYIQNGDSGFNDDFKDSGNQIYHFWAGFATAFNPDPIPITGARSYEAAIYNARGFVMADLGNTIHDSPLSPYMGQHGVSAEDYALTLAAMNVAAMAEPNSPMELVGIIVHRLGPDGGSYGFVEDWGWLWPTP